MKNDAAATTHVVRLAAIAAQHLVCNAVNEKTFTTAQGETFDQVTWDALRAEKAKAQVDLEALYEPLAPIGAFKSDRAAKIVMTKAERAYNAARDAENAKNSARRDCTDWEAHAAELILVEDAMHIARAYAFAIYTAARAQGFYVRSWTFDSNTTRDLIAMNMD